MKKTISLLLVLSLALSACAVGYERGFLQYPCANREYNPSLVTKGLNMRTGQENSPKKEVSSIEGINAAENSTQRMTQGGLSCHATITYEDGTKEAGTVIIRSMGDGVVRPSWIDWISDVDMPLVKAKQEANRQQKLQDEEDRKKRFYEGRPSSQYPYLAQMSCTYGQRHLPLAACMQTGNIQTNIEVRSGDEYSMVNAMSIRIANSILEKDDLQILLYPKFKIAMQNASKEMTMNLKIIDRQKNVVVYQKSAGQYVYIYANSNLISRAKAGAVPQPLSTQYQAEISCGSQPVFACFLAQGGRAGNYNTTLEIRDGDNYKLYQYQELVNVGNSMVIPLGNQFSISAQNSNSSSILNIKIKDKKIEKIIYEKSAGQFDFIRIRN